MKPVVIAAAIALGGCAVDRLPALATPGTPASEVAARIGKPIAQGVLPGGESYWDYSVQPMGYYNYRVTFDADERVRDVRNLLTAQNIARLEPGMTRAQVAEIVGTSLEPGRYANGTTSWSYRYDDAGVIKLLHVIFYPNDRVQSTTSEWDPRIYSKKGGGRSGR
jgi:outer membrane protein assembly factor BamE (lipoprotein component of BamABCDE complex)